MTGFLFGIVIGIPLGAWFAWERFLRYDRPVVEIKVTPEVANDLSGQLIRTWLARNDMTVMPRGKEFNWPGEVKS